MTGEEVTTWESNRCRYCGPIITGSRERRLLQNDATTEAREFLTELLQIAYSGRKTQEEALALLGAQISETASYICRSPCFASRARTRRHILRILRVRARAINIPRRHIRVSLVSRPLSRFYVGSGYRD